MGSERAVVRGPAEGRSVSLRGTEVVFKVESGGGVGASCVEFIAAPGFDTGLHVHERLEETFYVLDGEFEFRAGEKSYRATAGACMYVPPGVPHAFANRGTAPARLLLTLAPAGHDRYFDELAEVLAAEGPPDSGEIAALRKRYDTEQISSLTAGQKQGRRSRSRAVDGAPRA
jgi:mannose-6-phosphate isomerase-like protein (cupin superfamily)